jgi:hypothetical protein
METVKTPRGKGQIGGDRLRSPLSGDESFQGSAEVLFNGNALRLTAFMAVDFDRSAASACRSFRQS